MTDSIPPILIEKSLTAMDFRSVRIEVSMEQPRRKVQFLDQTQSANISIFYAQTFKGKRVFDQRIKSETSISHRAAFCDGARCANIQFYRDDIEKQQVIQIEHSFMDDMKSNQLSIPFPLHIFYVGARPLPEALTSGELFPSDEILFRVCRVVHFSEVGSRKQDMIYHIDSETGVPLKIENYWDKEQYASRLPFWVWEASDLENVSGYFLPMNSTYEEFVVVKDANGVWTSKSDMRQSIAVKKVEFNTAIEDSTFWPKFQKGVFVRDSITKKSYNASGVKGDETSSLKSDDFIRVENQRAWTSWYAGIGVASSVIILFAAILLKRRLG